MLMIITIVFSGLKQGTGISCTRCVSHTGYLQNENGNGEKRGRIRHQNNSKSVVKNLEERNVSSKKICPKQSQTSAKDLTIIHTEGHDSPTIG